MNFPRIMVLIAAERTDEVLGIAAIFWTRFSLTHHPLRPGGVVISGIGHRPIVTASAIVSIPRSTPAALDIVTLRTDIAFLAASSASTTFERFAHVPSPSSCEHNLGGGQIPHLAPYGLERGRHRPAWGCTEYSNLQMGWLVSSVVSRDSQWCSRPTGAECSLPQQPGPDRPHHPGHVRVRQGQPSRCNPSRM